MTIMTGIARISKLKTPFLGKNKRMESRVKKGEGKSQKEAWSLSPGRSE